MERKGRRSAEDARTGRFDPLRENLFQKVHIPLSFIGSKKVDKCEILYYNRYRI